MMTHLGEMRNRIAEIDADLLRLVAQRLQIAKSIGLEKKQRGVPLRDWEVERRVLDRAARAAGELEIPADLAREVMRVLIDAARAEQERHHYSAYKGTAERIVVVGGAGRMGRWLVRFFRDQGHRVWIQDNAPVVDGSPASVGLEDAVAGSTFVAVATALESVPGVIERLAEMRYDGVVFDIASLKGHLTGAINRARARGVSITSVHPMFGPDTRMLCDKVFCVCDCGDPHATGRVEAFIRPTAATLVHLTLEEHDEIVSYVLGLSHLVNIVFAKVLVDSGLSFDRLRRMESTTFLTQMRTTTSVVREHPGLYYDIQRCNPRSIDLYQRLNDAVRTVTDWVVGEHRTEFECFMKAGKQWVDQNDTR